MPKSFGEDHMLGHANRARAFLADQTHRPIQDMHFLCQATAKLEAVLEATSLERRSCA